MSFNQNHIPMHDEQFKIRQLIGDVLRYWYVFALVTPLVIGLAYLYLKKTPPKYKAETLVLIKADEKSGQLSEEGLFNELGFGNKMKNLENEMLVLQSTPLMIKVVEKLNLNYRYATRLGIRMADLYHNSPVEILNWQPYEPDGELWGTIQPDEKGGFLFEYRDKKFKGEFGKVLFLPDGRLTLSRERSIAMNSPLHIHIQSVRKRALQLLDAMEIIHIGKESSTLSLSIKDTSPERAHDILTELVTTYNNSTIDEKNQVYENSIDLINERINMIATELSEAESDVEAYKSRFSMTELSAEGSILMNEIAVNNKELSDKDVQLEILNSVEDFLIKNKDKFEFVPTNISINNLTLANQLVRFNQLLAEGARLRTDLGPSHPDLKLIEKQIQNLRQTIIDNIKAIKGDLQIASSASRDRKLMLESRLRSLPRRERELVEIERQKIIKENLYLYLLQKREESAISLAVTVANGKIVEPANIPATPVSPKTMQIWLIAIFLGLALPSGMALLINNLNDKVQFREDIEKVTEVPLLSMLSYNRNGKNLVIKENSRSISAEMFRLLRTNLSFIAPGEKLKTLLITSSMSGEGKSFISLNLGMTYALSGKKVLVLELDLRKPKQELYMGIKKSQKGLVNYLVNPETSPKEIIKNSGLHPNLDVITRGPKPPNPGEMILSPHLQKLIRLLKERYDLIILDTPPVGLVADAFQLKDSADASMYVVRAGHTRIGQIEIIDDITRHKKLPKAFIVLNAVQLGSIKNYGYNYGYGYGYGYEKGYGNGKGYFDEEKREKRRFKFIRKILKRTSSSQKEASHAKETTKSEKGNFRRNYSFERRRHQKPQDLEV